MPAQAHDALTRSFLRDKGWQPNTNRVAVSVLNRWQAWLAARDTQLVDATRDDVETYLKQRAAAGIAAGTRKVDWRMITALYAWASAEGERTSTGRKVKNVSAKVNPPKLVETRPDVLAEFEYRQMLKTCDRRTLRGRRDEAILSLLWWGAMRRSELVALDLADVDIDGNVTRFAGKPSVLITANKTSKLRRIGIHPDAAAAVDRYLRMRKLDDGPLLLSEKGDTHDERRLRPNSIQLVIRRRAKAAGITRSVGIHEFRRAWAIRARAAGMSDAAIMQHCGWTSLRMLVLYTRTENEELAASEFFDKMGAKTSTRRRRPAA
jgi:integrase